MSPQDLVEHALASSTAEDCVVIVRDRTSANLRWANNTLTTNGQMSSRSATVVSFVTAGDGVAAASTSGSATTPDDITAIVCAADAAARAAGPAEDANPLAQDRSTTDWDEPPVPTDISVYGTVAPALGEAFARARAGGRILYGFVDHAVTTTYLGSSTGLRLRHVQPGGHIACTAKDAALSTSAWLGAATLDFSDVDPLVLDEELARRLSWAGRPIELPAGRYDTILPPTAVADLMVDTYWYAGARDAWEGQSVYSQRPTGTRIGQRIAAAGVNLSSDPSAEGIACSPFVVVGASDSDHSVFDNGLPLARTEWIRDGELAALVQTRQTASLTQQPVTPYVDNLVLDISSGTGTVDDLVAGTERGLLLSSLWYIRLVDPQSLLLTVLTRDGVYLVEDGEITGAVNNFRWNESPVDLLRRFTHASATTRSLSREWGADYFPRTATPALRIPDFNMSSVSQAI